MSTKIKLYLDEDVHPDLAPVLRNMGFDVVTTIEVGNKGSTDEEQLEYARKNKRAVCTFNVKDFVQLYNHFYKENKQHAGIIVSSQINLPETLRRLVKLLNNTSAETIENSIEFLNNWK
jgi:predicted nuclease of predicted toxin-antitoxin system